ncbi:MAG: hypothetical protein AAF587_32855 [Bacteroidota bacterium]
MQISLSRYNLSLLLLVLLLCGGMAACDVAREKEGRGDVIARYQSEELYREDLNHFLSDSLKGEDSVRFARQFIRQWLRGEAIDEEAKREITGLEAKIAPQLENYKQSLIEHHYTQWLIEQNEDKFAVAEADIENYYNKFHENFISRSAYYQYFYLKTPKPNQFKVANLMRSPEPEKIDELIEWAVDNATEYKLDSSYVGETEISRLSPGFYFGNIRRASRTTLYPYQHQEGDTTYYDFYRLMDVIKEGDLLPLSLCRDRIINIIRNQRKNALIEQTKSKLLQKAEDAQKITVY